MSTTVTYKGNTIANVNNNTKTLKTAGKYMEDDVTLVDVTSGGSGGTYQAKTNIDPTTSSQTITADSGYDALSSVQINAMPVGVAGIPTATKETVSNNSVSVTPSVTNTTGYITGSTETGTPVTVSASELVSGSETKTENGTYDVTNLAELVVNVASSGGASNVVTGTFKGTTTGAAMDVNLNYSGNGYPILVVIYPDGGVRSGNSTFQNLVQRYAIQSFCSIKNVATSIPNYNSTSTTGSNDGADSCIVLRSYKNSTSSATSYSSTVTQNINTFSQMSPSTSGTYGSTTMRISSKTKMSVFIASTSYGFAANVDYKYWVLYSS